MKSVSIRLAADSMSDSIEEASVVATDATAWVRNRTSIVINSATSVSPGKCLAGFDPVGDVLGARPHQDGADLVDQGQHLLVDVDQFVDADAILADLVEGLDQLRPDDRGVVAALGAVLDADQAQPDQPVERRRVGDHPPGLGERDGLRLLGRPTARERRLQAEHVAKVLALLPGAEHLDSSAARVSDSDSTPALLTL